MNPYLMPGIIHQNMPKFMVLYTPKLEPWYLIDRSCVFWNVAFEHVTGSTRVAHVVEVRQVIMHMLVYCNKMTRENAGHFFDRDHTTVVHACRTVEDKYKYDKTFKKKYNEYLASLAIQEDTLEPEKLYVENNLSFRAWIIRVRAIAKINLPQISTGRRKLIFHSKPLLPYFQQGLTPDEAYLKVAKTLTTNNK
jgi:hypothetical protein